MEIDVETLAAICASPLPYDLFREVHKGLRRAIFDVIELAGCTDYQDPTERVQLAERAARLVALLNAHHHHEDTFVQPPLARHDPAVAAMVEEAHIDVDAALARLQQSAARLADLGGSDAVVAGLAFYRDWSAFAAIYLAHMAFEEGAVMAALREAMSVGELFALDLSIRTSIAPDQLCDFVADMAPAMNIDERCAMLTGLRTAAPPQIFEQVRAALQQALRPSEYVAIAGRLGLPS